MGALGKFTTNAQGDIRVTFRAPLVSLSGPYSVIGRSIVVRDAYWYTSLSLSLSLSQESVVIIVADTRGRQNKTAADRLWCHLPRSHHTNPETLTTLLAMWRP